MELYDNYIVFVLGADNFEISKIMRTISEQHGAIDEMYDQCVYLAKRFAEYDNIQNLCMTPPYEILEMFLKEYKEQILKYVINGEEFKVKEEF